ncbi:DUF6690 family protein [Botrimarina mediterranea]|uniref:DUF6690 domain-containing protein n=1 Tax=Botrimarina mediterranea TaxID=2528022 RepID=A0A518KBI0_9BACT|nr:DUF6690 family protein [Botrimarina mediterranea]QDV75151.1 hypothetical protein Spa11_33610 [Botrimarina mediterranea]QDV79797.1 hypothetical protein K2D_34130 [Planctomycetes bacterium K2D]
MIGRPLVLAGVLGAAAGGPYVLSQANNGGLPNPWAAPAAPAEAEAAPPPKQEFDPLGGGVARPPETGFRGGPGSHVYDSPASLVGPVGIPLEQAMDWGVDKNWVYRNWARKSTGLSDPTLFGVRVPLVTGAGMTDIAGSLTYYFDANGVLQRMTLHGRTADTSRLVHLATSRFAMQPASGSPGDQVFQAVEKKQLRGILRTRPEGTLWATSPHGSFTVDMDVTRPGGPYVAKSFAPRLEIPSAAPPPEPRLAEARGKNDDASPVLPSRSVVPDAKPIDPKASAAPADPNAVNGPPTPKLPEFGTPAAAPPPEVEKLDGYRDRFRWPG